MTKEQTQNTIDSFNYQWKYLSNAPYLLSDVRWRNNVESYILDELQLTRENIKDKSVIDVGCGNGRFTYGFYKLGCRVTAVDTSLSAIDQIRKTIPVESFNCDLFNLPVGKYDIVWCWGVIHHTKNPRLAVYKLQQLMHKDSILHLYVYSANRGLKMKLLRKLIHRLSFDKRIIVIEYLINAGILKGSIHGWFDALSPDINLEISESEIIKWLNENNLSYEKHIPAWCRGSKDIFCNSRMA